MKTYSLIAIALLGLMLFAVPFALADASLEADNTQIAADNLTANPGITPDSSFYGLKLGWEKVRLAFTFNQERKAEKELALADKRLLEIKRMAEKGNVKAALKAQKSHDALVERAKARLSSIQEDTKEAQVRNTAEKIIGLQRAIQAHENRIEVLKDVLAEQNLSDDARESIESAVERMENRTEVMSQRLKEKKDRVKTRLRAVTGDSEEEVDAVINKIENRTGLTDLDKKIAERGINRTERILERVKARIAEEKEAGVNVSAAEERISEAESKLAEAKVLYNEGKYSSVIVTLKPISNYGRNLSVIVRAINKARREHKLAEVRNLTKRVRNQRLQIIEARSERQNKWQNLSPEVREEIKGAIKEQLKQKPLEVSTNESQETEESNQSETD